ncbi:MAG TPA: Rieske 2Fe-2S domain-containing protein [Verrucomicrobiae bacterium]|nr:Rieske 2Fe-2S domain-containing protein [Verrucomicrobiae bacterium]
MEEASHEKLDLSAICHVGPDTAGGAMFRRYWLAISRSEDLKDIPQAVKILAEELVLFRDGKGRLGFMGLHCSHRGTSLEYGDIEERGIRCPYHGWLYDIAGNCLDQPLEPKGSIFCQKVKHPSYPVKELGGLIFAYLGPDKSDPPPLPRYSTLVRDDGTRLTLPPRHWDYNWFNFFENSADPAHVCVLHRHAGYGQQSWGNHFFSYTEMPQFEFVEMDYGMKVVMTKPGPTPGTEFIDEMSLALPSIVQVGDTEFVHAKMDAAALINEGSRCEHWMFVTPNDDDHFMLFTADNYLGPVANFYERLKELRERETPVQEVKPYDKRKFMPYKGNVRKEDIMTQGTQGLLGERQEQLGVSDRGVIRFRKIVLDAIAVAIDGGRPKGVITKDRASEVYGLDTQVGVRPVR